MRASTFDDESRELYDAVAPTYDEAYFAQALEKLEALVPGDGPLPRVEALPSAVRHPARQARRRVQGRHRRVPRSARVAHLTLPAGREFKVEYVTGKPWSGYNWYQGRFHSLIQVNTDLPIFIDRAHRSRLPRGLSRHHVYNVLLEKHLVRDRGWPEFTVYPLFSPQSLIAEGTANYGIEVAFPGDERVTLRARRALPAGRARSRARPKVLRDPAR